MMTLRQFSVEASTIPNITSWYLADLSKAQDKQELFTHQWPHKLRISGRSGGKRHHIRPFNQQSQR